MSNELEVHSKRTAEADYRKFLDGWRAKMDAGTLPADFPELDRMMLFFVSEAARGDESMASQVAGLVTQAILRGNKLDRFSETFILLTLDRIREDRSALRAIAGTKSARGAPKRGFTALANAVFIIMEISKHGSTLTQAEAKLVSERRVTKDAARRAWLTAKPKALAMLGIPPDTTVQQLRDRFYVPK